MLSDSRYSLISLPLSAVRHVAAESLPAHYQSQILFYFLSDHCVCALDFENAYGFV